MRVAFGTDCETSVTSSIVSCLEAAGFEVSDFSFGGDWVSVGRRVGESVASGDEAFGVVCCWTGTGVAMAANKVPGVRAALCTDSITASAARRYNDANVLAIGLRLTTAEVASEMVDAFVAGEADPAELSVIARLEPPGVLR